MSIYVNNKNSTLYKGDYYPSELYKGCKKIAGYSLKTFSGQTLSINGTYNDKPEEITINGGFVPSRNLFDKSLLFPSAIKEEEPWGGFGSTVMTNSNLMRILSGNKTYTFSYEVECVALPEGYENYTLTGNSYGFAIHSGVSGYPMIVTYLQGYRVKAGTTVKISTTFTTPADFSDSSVNYKLLGYTNKYEDSEGNRYYPTVIFRNIQIEEGDTETPYEAYKEPSYPVFSWNGKETTIPYILHKGEFLHSGGKTNPSKVVLYQGDTITDITQTDTGSMILNLTTSPHITTATISEGTLDVTVKIAE